MLKNKKNSQESNEITLLTISFGKRPSFLIASIRKRGENDTLEGVHILFAKYTKYPYPGSSHTVKKRNTNAKNCFVQIMRASCKEIVISKFLTSSNIFMVYSPVS